MRRDQVITEKTLELLLLKNLKYKKETFTCPGKTPDTGVEPPEWLGELGRDLQEARRAACFLAAIIFWAAVGQTF